MLLKATARLVAVTVAAVLQIGGASVRTYAPGTGPATRAAERLRSNREALESMPNFANDADSLATRAVAS